MSNTQHDYNAMTKRELVKLLAERTSDNVTNLRKFPKDSLVARAAEWVDRTVAAATPTATRRAAKTTGPQVHGGTTKGIEVPPAKHHYHLTSNGGSTFLRRDQPRKPGEDAKYRVVEEETMAFVVKSQHQLVIKLAEASRLMGTKVTAVRFFVG